jgi:hypothetical protein
LGPFPFIINLPPDFNEVGGITLTAQSDNGCSIVDSTICSILPTPSATSGPVPCFEVVINGDFDGSLSGWSGSNLSNFYWSSFNGGSAEYVGEGAYDSITQTGYTFLSGFSYNIYYDLYNTEESPAFIWPVLGTNGDTPSVMPTIPVSAWTSFSTTLECFGGDKLKFVAFNSSAVNPIYIDNVSACFTYGPCYYMEFGTNENFGVLGTGEVQYLDCDGVLQTYSASTAGDFYLCAVQSPGSIDIDVIGQDYLCDNVGGAWVGPTIPSQTPTPSNPPTPTPTNSISLSYGVLQFPYNNTSGANRQFRLTMEKSTSPQFQGPIYVDWDNGDPIQTYTGTTTFQQQKTMPNGSSGIIRVSGITTTPGQVESIYSFTISDVTTAYVAGSTYLTVNISELAKLKGSIRVIKSNTENGNISALSATPATEIWFSKGATGAISSLPSTVQKILFNYQTTVYGNTNNLPASIRWVTIDGTSLITGDTSSFVGQYPNLTQRLSLNGLSNISGLMSELPNCSTISINYGIQNTTSTLGAPIYLDLAYSSGNTISGTFTLKSNNELVQVCGRNTISGNLSSTSAATNLAILTITGLNTISGDVGLLRLPNHTVVIGGNNTLSGNISTFASNTNIGIIRNIIIAQQGNISNGPTDLGNNPDTQTQTSYRHNIVSSGNTITGNFTTLQTAVSLLNVYFGGSNTVSGNIGSLSNISGLQTFTHISNANAPITATFANPLSGVFSGYYLIYVRNSSFSMDASSVNSLFNYLGGKITGAEPNCTPTGIKEVVIIGSGNAAPTSSSLTNRNKVNNCFGHIVTN